MENPKFNIKKHFLKTNKILHLSIILSYWITLISAFTLPHDIPIAFFDAEITDDFFSIEMKFDIEDLEQTLEIININKPFQEKLKQYISENSIFIINNQMTFYEFCAIEKDSEHYFIFAELKSVLSPVQSIKFQNTCLLNIENHSNLLQINYSNKFRTFRLHQKRTETFFEL